MAVRLSIFERVRFWLHSKRKPVAPSLGVLCDALKAQIKRGGPGSDLAAAELKGIRAAQLARVRS